MTGKIFENVNAKRLFVSLYEETPEARKSTFGQNIRDMFDHKITDLESIEGFYLTEADVRMCHKAAMETPNDVKSDGVVENLMDNLNPIVTGMTKFKENEDTKVYENNIPKNW